MEERAARLGYAKIRVTWSTRRASSKRLNLPLQLLHSRCLLKQSDLDDVFWVLLEGTVTGAIYLQLHAITLCSRSQLLKMSNLELHDGERRYSQDIANTIAGAKKIVVVAGAGISTNCGIPVCQIVIYAISDPRPEDSNLIN